MDKANGYRCVNCSKSVSALYKTYGPSVLKLTKCEECRGIVDKYIEYDPVIVMIDLVLISKEAQRHIIYNTEFKAYWKLLVILMMFETYELWRNDSLFNILVNTMCGISSCDSHLISNNTILSVLNNFTLPETVKLKCSYWKTEYKEEEDLFLIEREFYVVQFLSTFAGIVVFLMLLHGTMKLILWRKDKKVCLLKLLKAFSLGNVSILFTLPMLVWGTDTSLDTKLVHYVLVFLYSYVVFLSVFTVLYECSLPATTITLLISNLAKYTTTFYMTIFIKSSILNVIV